MRDHRRKAMQRREFDRLVARRDNLELARHFAEAACVELPAALCMLRLLNFQGICRLLEQVQERLDSALALERSPVPA
jgi:hypothetical protein